jgi:hypothetical protein
MDSGDGISRESYYDVITRLREPLSYFDAALRFFELTNGRLRFEAGVLHRYVKRSVKNAQWMHDINWLVIYVICWMVIGIENGEPVEPTLQAGWMIFRTHAGQGEFSDTAFLAVEKAVEVVALAAGDQSDRAVLTLLYTILERWCPSDKPLF